MVNDPNFNALIFKEGERENEYSRLLPGQKPHVSKNGSIFYKIDGGKIIDAGRSFKLVYDKTEKALREFMDLAKIKFGTMSALVIQGSKEFKEQVHELNKTMGLKLFIVNVKSRTNERNQLENRGME
jgi:hypothetical protein